ncbi:hypothetical protein EKJ_26350 [Qipengyuania flava]|uniref:DUF5681 domain-containing protein n=1 Tax=Qipengyuania flava TaxID=192812 RepID=A0A3T1CLS2_9SPHN|nr:DUF5681 domain-containing protein [Qipengyuania flava]BBI21788.1 hypothetical protein EKJ_26350 [Qipengyuania flava]
MSNPSNDWISAFPEDDESPTRALPPARSRARHRPVEPAVENPVEAPPTPSPTSTDYEEVIKPINDYNPDGGSGATDAYQVGYGKPPAHTRFKPGQSGNPKGRPKAAKGLNTIVRETLGSKVSVRTASGTKRISKIEAVLQKTLEKALKGDARAQLELMKLWKNAVPDQVSFESPEDHTEGLTAADLAILEAYRADIATGGEEPCA